LTVASWPIPADPNTSADRPLLRKKSFVAMLVEDRNPFQTSGFRKERWYLNPERKLTYPHRKRRHGRGDMNWEAVGAISEAVGVSAVVVSLVYLAIQVREQSRETRIASSYELTSAFRETISWLTDPQNAEVALAASSDIEQLTDAQRLQFNTFCIQYFRVWEQAHYQYSEGRLDESTWQSILSQFRDVVSVDAFRTVWAMRKHVFRAEFSEFVNTMLETIEGTEYRLK
jgi:hypothetical protein